MADVEVIRLVDVPFTIADVLSEAASSASAHGGTALLDDFETVYSSGLGIVAFYFDAVDSNSASDY